MIEKNKKHFSVFSALASGRLFSGISPEQVESIFSTLPYKTRTYHKGAIIMFRGDEYSELLFLCRGDVAAEIHDINGKTLKIETLRAPDIIAPGILFSDDNHLPVTITAQNDAEIIALSKKTVLALCQKNMQFLLNLMLDTGNKVVILAEKLRLIRFKTIRQKIAGYLLDQADRQGTDSIELRLSKETLAEVFGIARPSLSRVFAELTNEHVLAQEGKIVHILNKEALTLFLDDES